MKAASPGDLDLPPGTAGLPGAADEATMARRLIYGHQPGRLGLSIDKLLFFQRFCFFILTFYL